MPLLAAALLAPSSLSAAEFMDGGFETQGPGTISFCYFGSCPAGAWTGSGAGLQGENNGAFPGTDTPDESNYGFIHEHGTLSQSFTAATSGLFTLSWLDAGRRQAGVNPASIGNVTYEVALNDLLLGTFSTTTGQLFTERSSLTPFALAAGASYTLRFAGTSTNPANAFIDRVAFTSASAVADAVPEPATWAMMIVGFGLVGGAMRRRARQHPIAPTVAS